MEAENQTQSIQAPESPEYFLLWGSGVSLNLVMKLIEKLNAASSETEFNRIVDVIKKVFQNIGIGWNTVDVPTAYFDTDSPANNNMLVVDFGDYEITVSSCSINLWRKPSSYEE